MSKGEELSRLPGYRVKLSFRQDCSCVLLSTQAHLDLVVTNLGASAPGIEIISDVGATKKHKVKNQRGNNMGLSENVVYPYTQWFS